MPFPHFGTVLFAILAFICPIVLFFSGMLLHRRIVQERQRKIMMTRVSGLDPPVGTRDPALLWPSALAKSPTASQASKSSGGSNNNHAVAIDMDSVVVIGRRRTGVPEVGSNTNSNSSNIVSSPGRAQDAHKGSSSSSAARALQTAQHQQQSRQVESALSQRVSEHNKRFLSKVSTEFEALAPTNSNSTVYYSFSDDSSSQTTQQQQQGRHSADAPKQQQQQQQQRRLSTAMDADVGSSRDQRHTKRCASVPVLSAAAHAAALSRSIDVDLGLRPGISSSTVPHVSRTQYTAVLQQQIQQQRQPLPVI